MKKYCLGFILFLSLFMLTGCRKTIVGKWKSIDGEDEYYYIFNKDRTCSYELPVARLDCTYEIDDEKITILYKGNDKATTFEYKFKGNSLIIIDDRNNYNEFIKEKSK